VGDLALAALEAGRAAGAREGAGGVLAPTERKMLLLENMVPSVI